MWFTFCCSDFDNPCELFSAFEISGNCPVQLAAHGIPCTCPFNPTTIDLPPSVFVVPNFDAGWIPIYPVSRRFPTVFFLPIFFHKALRFSFISGKIPSTSRNDPRTCHRRMLWNWAGHQMPFIFTWLSVCITQFRLDMNHNDIFFFCLYVENAVCLHLIYTATDKLVFPCSYFEKKNPLISH